MSLARSVSARAFTIANVPLNADVVWFAVPDREIVRAARQLAARAEWKGKVALHSSGALTSDELDSLRKRGAAVASVHPLMTFTGRSVPSLRDVPFALEGDAAAVRLARNVVRRLGGRPFTIGKDSKVAYHAWGAFASPLLIALLAAAEEVAKLAGVSSTEARKKMLPIVRQTIANYAALGPKKALTGPLVRGDVETVRKHLRVLGRAPRARNVYLALSNAALSAFSLGESNGLRNFSN